MLTFFRKIRKSSIKSTSLQKYFLYALGEIILVVIGILIALQINNWNLNRVERNKEKLLLKEIYSEFKINKEELESTIYAYSDVRRRCQYLQNLFPINIQEINIDSFSFALNRISGVPSADLSMGSISSIINTSSFEIISDPELRSLLIQWEDLIADYFEREGQTIDYTLHTIIPYLSDKIPQPYSIGLSDNRVDLSFLNTIAFENLINDKMWTVKQILLSVENKEAKIRKALDQIILLSEG